MYGLDRLRDIRWLEYYLFGGVPATPEPMYGRGDYHHHGAIRHTRYRIDGRADEHREVGTVTGYVEFDVDTGEFTIHSYESIGRAES
jgi:hypothetical protein